MTSATPVSLPLYVSHVVWMGTARPADVHQLRCRTWALLWVHAQEWDSWSHAASTCKFLRNLRPELRIVLWLGTPTHNKPKFFFPYSPQHVVIKKSSNWKLLRWSLPSSLRILRIQKAAGMEQNSGINNADLAWGVVKHWVNIHRALIIVPAK